MDKEMNEQLETALSVMLETHKNQIDKAGMPYVLHPLRVMNEVEQLDYKVVALLHDVVEDAKIDNEQMLSELRAWHGFLFDIVDDVNVLSRRDGELYIDYINRIIDSKSKRALSVKLADLNDNLNTERLKLLSEKDRYRLINKYLTARNKITAALIELNGDGK